MFSEGNAMWHLHVLTQRYCSWWCPSAWPRCSAWWTQWSSLQVKIHSSCLNASTKYARWGSHLCLISSILAINIPWPYSQHGAFSLGTSWQMQVASHREVCDVLSNTKTTLPKLKSVLQSTGVAGISKGGSSSFWKVSFSREVAGCFASGWCSQGHRFTCGSARREQLILNTASEEAC